MKKLIAALAGLGMATPSAAAFVVDGNLAAAITAAISTAGLTMLVVSWIDKRIDHKIKTYASTVRIQHYVVLRELSNIRVLFGHPPLNIPEILEDEKETG
jgi:hypothetical protein